MSYISVIVLLSISFYLNLVIADTSEANIYVLSMVASGTCLLAIIFVISTHEEGERKYEMIRKRFEEAEEKLRQEFHFV